MAGNCYEAAGSALMDAWMGGDAEGLVLVHGRPTLQGEPFIEYGHAWLERTVDADTIGGRTFRVVLCRDVEQEIDLPRDLFYRIGRIDLARCFRYDFEAMRRWITETGHWGPWEGPEACGPVDDEGED